MVLRGEDDAGEAGGFGGSDPLGGVEAGRVEDGRVGFAGAPLGVGEGVGAEVEEHGHGSELPLELLGGREGWERERVWF